MDEIDIIMELRVIFRNLQDKFNWRYNGLLDINISKRLRSNNGNCYYQFDF